MSGLIAVAQQGDGAGADVWVVCGFRRSMKVTGAAARAGTFYSARSIVSATSPYFSGFGHPVFGATALGCDNWCSRQKTGRALAFRTGRVEIRTRIVNRN